ncbi:hypothetical protein ABH930_004524 [Kitasatospora sp. GAS204A]|nr:hypothetical protein [Kitasatospora sp. GAS204B]
MTAGVAGTASLTVRSSSCFTAQALGVGVRDAFGDNLDFPGEAHQVQICPTGLTITTGARAFAAGTYTEFGFYQDQSGQWHNLTSLTLQVAAAQPPAPSTPASPVPGQSLIWSDEFNGPIAWGTRWVGDKTSAYQYGNHNPNDDKLDWLSDSNVSVSNGAATFTAQPSAHILENGLQAWTTGFLTTEGSQEGFQVKTGDYVETRVQMPNALGAWPALWTWKNGNNEVDSFEYHPDNPSLLEMTNHVLPAQRYLSDPADVAPGQWVTIGTHYGATSVDWYVNGAKVFSDGQGVGANWSAYLILNLSISAGHYHPAPQGNSPITFSVDYIRVFG